MQAATAADNLEGIVSWFSKIMCFFGRVDSQARFVSLLVQGREIE
jgi:hypothetical protein